MIYTTRLSSRHCASLNMLLKHDDDMRTVSCPAYTKDAISSKKLELRAQNCSFMIHQQTPIQY